MEQAGIEGRDETCLVEMAIRHDPEGAIVIRKIDCSIHAPISALKADLAYVCGIEPEEQQWSVRGTILADGDSLELHQIHLMEKPQILIENNRLVP